MLLRRERRNCSREAAQGVDPGEEGRADRGNEPGVAPSWSPGDSMRAQRVGSFVAALLRMTCVDMCRLCGWGARLLPATEPRARSAFLRLPTPDRDRYQTPPLS